MWKKYKFELNFKRCGCRGYPANRWKSIKLSEFLRGARTTPAGKRRRKKSRDGANNLIQDADSKFLRKKVDLVQ